MTTDHEESPAPSRRFPIRSLLAATVLVTLALVGPSVTVTSLRIGPRARGVKVRNDLQLILAAAEQFRVAREKYPRDLAELLAFEDASDPNAISFCGFLPTDPWGRAYEYRLARGSPVARCLGSDGAAGGCGEAADITLAGTNVTSRRHEFVQRRSASPRPSFERSEDSSASGRARIPR